ncbi:MAG: CpXC domain-containing protein [Treponema sp.]|nr:CpXC domain-containing protein [Treponema sp.]MCL2251212.1 CpXC domain-containing protein [Treponema sp.]
MKKNINCPCGNNISFEFTEEIDLDNHPLTLDSIFDGTFLSFNCPVCKKLHKPEYKVTLFWKSKNYNFIVIPELERGDFYLNKKNNPNSKNKSEDVLSFETLIGYPEMADRLTVIKDGLEPIVIETLKSYLLAKAMENYPKHNINAWYYCSSSDGIEFHLDGIMQNQVAVMKIPMDVYKNTLNVFKKQPKKAIFVSLRVSNYLSVQNILRPDVLK